MENFENYSFKYNLNKEDYLNYSLFNAYHLKCVQKGRTYFKFFVTIVYLIFFISIAFFIDFDITSTIFIFIISLFFCIKMWFSTDKNRYIKGYKSQIEETFDQFSNDNIEINFLTEKLIYKNKIKELIISYEGLKNITETKDYIYLKLRDHSYIFFPRKIENFEKIKSILKHISKVYNFPYTENLDWKWK